MKAKLIGVISVLGTGVALSTWFALRASAAEEVDIPVHESVANQYVMGVVYPIPVSIGDLLSRGHR